MQDEEKGIKEMEERIAEAAKEEGSNIPDENHLPAEIKPTFVRRCCEHTEKGDGILHSAIWRGKLVYVPELRQWFTWQGQRWIKVNSHFVESSVDAVAAKYRETSEYYKKLSREAKDAGDKDEGNRLEAVAGRLFARAKYLDTSKGVSACMRFTLANDNPLIIAPDIWDGDPMLLGVQNGVVDLRSGELRNGRPSDYMLKACTVEWIDIDAPCPLWETFLDDVLGTTPDVIDYVHRVLGYSITGLSCEPLFLMLYGERGRNGKTIIMETLKEILGPYMGPMPAEMLLDRKIPKDPDSPSPTLMNLNGLRVVWAAETDENRRFSTSQVKLLSGSDTLTGRYPWDKENTEFVPTHTLFLMTNFLPSAPAHDTAFWERLKLLNFPHRFIDEPKEPNERKRDSKLKEKLKKELSGILAWLVRGCLKYQLEGLIPPQSIKASTTQYQSDEDIIQLFIDQTLERTNNDEDRINATVMYELYTTWHKKYVNAKSCPSMHTFGKRLSSKIERKAIGGHRYYVKVIRCDDIDGL